MLDVIEQLSDIPFQLKTHNICDSDAGEGKTRSSLETLLLGVSIPWFCMSHYVRRNSEKSILYHI
jgi:hypothetical protein